MKPTGLLSTLAVISIAGGFGVRQIPVPMDQDRLSQRFALYDDRAWRGAPRGPAYPGDPDAEVFEKAADWAIDYDKELSANDRALIVKARNRANERFKALKDGKPAWHTRKGRLVRGYRSEVDGSVQPYGLVIPDSYDPSRPTRLDVVLHGSTRPIGMSELRFIAGFDEGDGTGSGPTDRDYIELYPLGRVENCYRWAGETDVFEAIADVKKHYNIDDRRIVLRGMSMGASGTWHLGLKHPDFFVAIGPYCGYVDTHRFSETPGMNFLKVGPLPPWQEAGLHMLDSVDYAANAGVVPCIAAIGENDPFFQAHVIMGEAMKREGLEMVNLISPGTGHVQEPKTFAEQMRRIGEYASKGLNTAPKHIRFVTWTLKYSKCHWIELLALDHQYERAEIVADSTPGGVYNIQKLTNVRRFRISVYSPFGPLTQVSILERHIKTPKFENVRSGRGGPTLEFERTGTQWKCIGIASCPFVGKQPGIQGPIDDAFTKPFLCVRGSGLPWDPPVQFWSDAQLKRFAYEWRRYFRGDLPIKQMEEVTAADRQNANLILFGDPGSNKLIRELLSKLPIKWTKDQLVVAGKSYAAGSHVPVLIFPMPSSNGGSKHYVVINSGHTFHESELNRLNYLLFPRLGDWAVFKVGETQHASPSDPLNEELLQAGYFDENWKFARAQKL